MSIDAGDDLKLASIDLQYCTVGGKQWPTLIG
jgi:hypothetical protein